MKAVLLMCWMFFLAVMTGIDCARGEVPAAMNYQGRLLDDLGHPLSNGTYQVEFRFWDDATASSNLIWGRSFAVEVMSNGLYAVLLTDEGAPVNETASKDQLSEVFDSAERYLGLTIVGTPEGSVSPASEISPRQQFLSAPYVFKTAFAVNADEAKKADHAGSAEFADKAEGASGGFSVQGSLNVSGATALNSGVSAVAGPVTVRGDVEITGNVNIPSSHKLRAYGVAPTGCIILWFGSAEDIPEGWARCDGSIRNNIKTPNLCNRFVVGAENDAELGKTGGASEVTLSKGQMPRHHHSFDVCRSDDAGMHDSVETDDDLWRYSKTRTSSSVGGTQPHNNLPPYYTLHYIMKVQ